MKTGPLFPKSRNGPVLRGTQLAREAVPDLSHQTARKNGVKAVTAGDFITVEATGKKGRFISIGTVSALQYQYTSALNVPNYHYPVPTARTVVFSKDARLFSRDKVQAASTRHAFALQRVPLGRLAIMDGEPVFGAVVPGQWATYPDNATTISLKITRDGINFTTLLSKTMAVDYGTFFAAQYNKQIRRAQYVLGSVYATDSARTWTAGFVTTVIGTTGYNLIYIYRGEDGTQQERLIWPDSTPVTEAKVIRVGPKTLLAVGVRSSAYVARLSTNNGNTWSTVTGLEAYSASLGQRIVNSTITVVHESAGSPAGTYTSTHDGHGVAVGPSVDRIFVLPESASTAIIILNNYAWGGGEFTGSTTHTTAQTGTTAERTHCFYPMSDPLIPCVPAPLTITPVFSTFCTGFNAAFVAAPPVHPAVFRVTFSSSSATKVADIKNVVGDLAAPLIPFSAHFFGSLFAVAPNAYWTGGTTSVSNPNAGWWSTAPGSISGTSDPLGIGSEVVGDYLEDQPPILPAAGFVQRIPITSSPYLTYTKSSTNTSTFPDGISTGIDVLFAEPAITANVIKMRMIDMTPRRFLIYNDEPMTLSGTSNLVLKQKQFWTEDWVTMSRLPDLPWNASYIGRRRWLGNTILLPVFSPGKGVVLYQSKNLGATWVRRGTIRTGVNTPPTFDTYKQLLTTYPVVEWFNDDKGRIASANPYSGAWICDDRRPAPTL